MSHKASLPSPEGNESETVQFMGGFGKAGLSKYGTWALDNLLFLYLYDGPLFGNGFLIGVG